VVPSSAADADPAEEATSSRRSWRDRTAWARDRSAPLRSFIRTESASAVVLVAAITAALIWANVSDASYESVWRTDFNVNLGRYSIDQDLRTWLNGGLMTLFFLVVGLETRREFDLGDLRERRRLVLPLVAGIAGMIVPVGIYLLVNLGHTTEHGWGVAMSTDTALALGVLAVMGRDIPERMRLFLLTLFVADDITALGVIAVVYTDHVTLTPLLGAIGAYALLVGAVRLRLQQRSVFVALGIITWAFLRASGIDPIVSGLAIGLAAPAYTPARDELRTATELVRRFREQPTPELARTARVGLSATLSPNARLQTFYHGWTSYVIVPLFALANAGIVLKPAFLSRAYVAPVTLGVLIGYVLGKPIAVIASARAVTALSRGRIRPPIGDAAVIASGTIAGVGFTVSLLIADRAFSGVELDEAKLGALSGALLAALATWTVLRLTALLPAPRRTRALLGDPRLIQDLTPAVDPEHDHVRGPHHAAITIIEFGDFECPYCGQAEPIVRELLSDTSIRYVWRHLPLTDVHPQAELAAEASEAAATQGAFWPMHDLLLSHQDQLARADLIRFAGDLNLDTERFAEELDDGKHAVRVAQDVESADISGVSGTPTFFINGQRHYGAYDITTLTTAIGDERRRLAARQSR
jgi:Na+/H+ antiporter NhaA